MEKEVAKGTKKIIKISLLVKVLIVLFICIFIVTFVVKKEDGSWDDDSVTYIAREQAQVMNSTAIISPSSENGTNRKI